MSNGFNFGEFASAPVKKTKKVQAELPQEYLGFMSAVASSGNRIDYSGHSLLCGRLGMISPGASRLPNGGNRFLDRLPLGIQFMVTRKNGTYHESAKAKWSTAAPEGYESFPVIAGEAVLLAHTAWCAEQE